MKAQAENTSSYLPPKSSQARKKPSPPPPVSFGRVLASSAPVKGTTVSYDLVYKTTLTRVIMTTSVYRRGTVHCGTVCSKQEDAGERQHVVLAHGRSCLSVSSQARPCLQVRSSPVPFLPRPILAQTRSSPGPFLPRPVLIQAHSCPGPFWALGPFIPTPVLAQVRFFLGLSSPCPFLPTPVLAQVRPCPGNH